MPESMPHTQDTRNMTNKRSYPPEDEFELYDKLIMGEGNSGFKELDRMVPTGYLDRQEIGFVRQLANELEYVRYLENRLAQILDTEVDLNRIKTQLLEKIMFFTHSSKALQGFGIKAVGTQRLIQDEQVFQQMKEEKEKGAIDKLTSKGGQAVDEITGGGDVQFTNEKNQEIWR